MQKSIADFIIDGSIVIDSLEAFSRILKEFPGRPELLRMHADMLVAGRLQAAAVKQYNRAARLFLDSGRLLQAWVAKILQWQVQRPSRDQLLEFHRAIQSTPHNGAPADDFIQHFDPMERMAVFSCFRLICTPAGKTVLKAGRRRADLYLVVSGVLKESCYEMLSHKARFRREACRVLWEADSFGEVYPFSEDNPIQPHVVATTRSELLVISRSCLIRACNSHSGVESGVIRLCGIRSKKKAEPTSSEVRKGMRFSIPIDISVEVLPASKNEPPIIMKGYCQDLSVSGVSFIPEGNGTHPNPGGPVTVEDLINRRVRVTLPADDFSMAISGQIVRKRNVVVKGLRIQSLGIQFAKMPPRLRGAFFALAESAQSSDSSPRR